MNFLMGMSIFLVGYLLTGCNKQSFGKLDKIPYSTKECRKRLAIGSEIDSYL